MSDDWYYAGEAKSVGPLSINELRYALQQIPDWKNVLVCVAGEMIWREAGSVPELEPPCPPPLPSPSRALPAQPAMLTFAETVVSTELKSSAKKVLRWVLIIFAAIVGMTVGKTIVRELLKAANSSTAMTRKQASYTVSTPSQRNASPQCCSDPEIDLTKFGPKSPQAEQRR